MNVSDPFNLKINGQESCNLVQYADFELLFCEKSIKSMKEKLDTLS